MKTSRFSCFAVLCLVLAGAAGEISVATAQQGSLFGPRDFGGEIVFRLDRPEAKPPTKTAPPAAKAPVKPAVKDDLKLQGTVSNKYVKPSDLLLKDGVLKNGVVSKLPALPNSSTFNVKQPLDKGWEQVSQRSAGELPQAIAKAKLNFRGFTPYGVKLTPAKNPTLKVLVVNDSMQFEYAVRGNVVESHFTTPDIVNIKTPFGRIHAGAPKAADPRVILHFDLVFRVTVTPQLKGAPTVSSVRVEVQNAKLQPGNFSAEVAKMANDVLAFFSGTNFQRMAEATINKQGATLANPLADAVKGLNQRLAPLTTGVRSVTVAHIGSQIHVIYSTKADTGPIVH